jgi:hypothetical protein
VPGAITAIFAATHGKFSWSSSQRASCVFLCLKSGYLSFVYNQRFTSIWSAMYSPHPRHKWHHKNRFLICWKSCTDLLHQNIAFAIYLPSPAYYYYPISAKDLKRIPAKFRPGQDSDQERATRLTPTRALHWHLNSERFDVHLPYLIYDPTIAKDP